LAKVPETFNLSLCCGPETLIQDPTFIIVLRSPDPTSTSRLILRVSGDLAFEARGVAGVGIALSAMAERSILDWIPNDSDVTERNRFSHVQTVDTLPNPPRIDSKPSTTAPPVPTDWGPEEFPSLGDVPTTTTNNSKANGKEKSKKKQTGHQKQQSTTRPNTNHVESVVPKDPAESKKSAASMKKASATSIPGISNHDLIDTECILYAKVSFVILLNTSLLISIFSTKSRSEAMTCLRIQSFGHMMRSSQASTK
uniref:REJ domain-containing protein n=1 Tax=Echinostoma caproni TaxID=27848 RepID=A0A183BFL5_9TREM